VEIFPAYEILHAGAMIIRLDAETIIARHARDPARSIHDELQGASGRLDRRPWEDRSNML
jgi:hypothetical protein